MAYEMRISDWSSDVCSSDLSCEVETPCRSEGRLDFARRKRARGFHHFEATPTIPASIRCAISPDESDKRRSEEHTSELQSLMRISYAVYCLKKKTHTEAERHDYDLQ